MAETIYEVGYSVSVISAALLNNSNYGLSCQYAINGNNVDSTDGTITGCAWGVNNLTATVTFAGITKTSSAHSCHITGLPYKKDFTSDKSTAGWERLSTSHNLKAICLGYKYGSGTITYKVFSPIFPLPTKTKISYTAVHYYGATGLYSPSGTIYSGVTNNNTTVKTKNASIKGDSKYLTTETPKEFPLKDDVEMNNSSRISLSGSCGAEYLVENYVELARIEILYRSN